MRCKFHHNLLSIVIMASFFWGATLSFAAIPKSVTLTAFITGSAQAPLNKPIFFTEMPGKPGYYVVLEQHLGQVSIFNRTSPTAAWTKTIMDTVVIPSAVRSWNEMGLLGIAFHPNYAQNHKYYLYYNPTYASGSGSLTYVIERKSDASFLKRDTTSATRLLISIPGPYDNHKGGTIAFSPKDGYLYIGTGDGGPGSGQDPGNRSANPDSLLGKMLRIDPDHPANGKQYGIPTDNPFVGGGHREEIFSLGLRNPFRWSFDPLTGNIWLGHVGQNNWESVTLVPKGSNLGWRIWEGSHCNPTYGTTCSATGIYMPFFTYPHSGNGDTTGNCVIGGHVYRGNPASPFYGLYFYGDNGNNKIWAIQRDSVTNTKKDYALEATMPGSAGQQTGMTSFGVDLSGSLYVVRRGTSSLTATDGIIYAITSPDMVPVAISPRHTAKAFAPLSVRELSTMKLNDLQGRKVSGSLPHSGVYVTQRPGENAPALVPVLK